MIYILCDTYIVVMQSPSQHTPLCVLKLFAHTIAVAEFAAITSLMTYFSHRIDMLTHFYKSYECSNNLNRDKQHAEWSTPATR